MLIKIRLTMNRTEEIDVKPLKCNVENVVYCKCDKYYEAYDFKSGLFICREEKLKDLIITVEKLEKELKSAREILYKDKEEIINNHGGLF